MTLQQAQAKERRIDDKLKETKRKYDINPTSKLSAEISYLLTELTDQQLYIAVKWGKK